MKDGKRIELCLELLHLKDRHELDHVLGCTGCYVFDSYDGGGPHYCQAFNVEFRGYVPSPPREPTETERLVQRIWNPELLMQMTPVLRYEQFTKATGSSK